MSKTSFLGAGALTALLAVAGLAVVAVTQDAVAQTQGGWRKELADKAQQAQAAGQKGNYSEAIRLLKEAKAKAPLSPQEEQGINELMIWAASGAKDHKLVLATVDERLATGRVTGADLTRKLRLKATTHYALRDYRGAAATFDKLAAQGALTADDLTLLATCQMQLRDYTKATTTLERAIAANDKAGRAGKNAALLEMLNSAYFETKNDAKRMQTLHRLMAVAPKASTFKQLASAYEVESMRDPVVMINVYRLGASKNVLSARALRQVRRDGARPLEPGRSGCDAGERHGGRRDQEGRPQQPHPGGREVAARARQGDAAAAGGGSQGHQDG